MKKTFLHSINLAAALLVSGLLAPTPAKADTFNFTSCHLSDGCGTVTQFGTVTLTQAGTSVNFDVVLNSGNRFVETGAGGNSFFLFNDSLLNSTVTNITATLNGATVSQPPGGLSGLTSQSISADGTGSWTAQVFCTVASDCNGGSTPNINDLHFTVTNATLAQLETLNGSGNMFVADILLGQTGGTGLTGPVDVSTPAVPEPSSLAFVGIGLAGIATKVYRNRRQA